MIKNLSKLLFTIILFCIFTSIEGGTVTKIYKGIDVSPKKILNVFVTVYKYTEENCVTADGSIIRPGVFWCAASPDLIKNHNLSFGDTIFYKDVGYALHDLTHKRLKSTIDILIHDHKVFSEFADIYIENTE